MSHLRFTFSAIVTGLLLVASAPAAHASLLQTGSEWQPQVGDEFVVDVANNMGYLLHQAEATYFSFPVATGQQRWIRYLGMTYFGATREGTWVVKERNMKSAKSMFGNGRFLRLYRDGKYSHYGIHSYWDAPAWMEDEDRYKSLGCIVVTEDILDIIEQTYFLNGNELKVTTTAGQEQLHQMLAFRVFVQSRLTANESEGIQ